MAVAACGLAARLHRIRTGPEAVALARRQARPAGVLRAAVRRYRGPACLAGIPARTAACRLIAETGLPLDAWRRGKILRGTLSPRSTNSGASPPLERPWRPVTRELYPGVAGAGGVIMAATIALSCLAISVYLVHPIIQRCDSRGGCGYFPCRQAGLSLLDDGTYRTFYGHPLLSRAVNAAKLTNLILCRPSFRFFRRNRPASSRITAGARSSLCPPWPLSQRPGSLRQWLCPRRDHRARAGRCPAG